MRELDRLDQRYGLGADPRQFRRVPRRRAPRATGGLGAAAALLASFALLLFLPNPVGEQLRRVLHLPDDRLAPTVVSFGHGSHAFQATQPGTDVPVSYSPCHPIHYVVNPDGGPPGAVGLVRDAVAEVSRRSGFVFTYDGTTEDRAFARTGGPVLVGFATDEEFGHLATSGDAVGVGGSSYVDGGVGFRQYRTGMVALKASWFRHSAVMAREDEERAVVLHELGHVLGLAHVDDRGELMYRSLTRTSFGPGDLEGLAALGRVRCG